MPLFSIILPTFNRAHLIEEAINSVLNQTLVSWELIIVDNASTDNTKEVIAQFKDNRIRYFFQNVKGRSAARNYGIHQSNGNWICFLDSDDAYLPNHLEVFQKEISAFPNSAIFKSGITFKDEDQNTVFESQYLSNSQPQHEFVVTNYCSILDMCIQKEIAHKYEFEHIETWEDKAYILDLLQDSTIHQIRERTVIAYDHSGRSIIKAYENEADINEVFNVMSSKLEKHNVSINFIRKVQQRFLLTILLNAKKNSNDANIQNRLISNLNINPTFLTRLKLFLTGILNR